MLTGCEKNAAQEENERLTLENNLFRMANRDLSDVMKEAVDYLGEVHYENGLPVYRNKIEATSILHTKMKQTIHHE